MNSTPVDRIIELLGRHQSFLIVAHEQPEADAIGSTLALRRTLHRMGKQAEAVNKDGIPGNCRFLPDSELLLLTPTHQKYDVVLVVDTDGANRIALPVAPTLYADLVLQIDHHATGKPYGNVSWVDPGCSAAGEMIYGLLRRMDSVLDSETATLLFAAIATDTGFFKYGNTTPTSLEIGAELLRAGAQSTLVAQRLIDEKTYSATKLLATALTSMKRSLDGALCWSELSLQAFESSGATTDETEGIVNHLLNVSGVKIAVLFRQEKNGKVKMSFRSKDQVDVGTLAKSFGGGGHRQAAGCTLEGSLEDVQRQVLERTRDWIKNL